MTSPTPRSPRSRSQASSRRSRHHHHHHHHQHQHQHLLHSDCPPELDDDDEGGGGGGGDTNTSPQLNQQRSVSLTTLQSTAVIQPRMAQLETLEAKMASIEVSLSSTPRRKKNGSLSGMSLGSSIRSIPKEIAVKELESLRNALRDKENIIQNLKGQLTIPGLRLTPMKNPNGTNNRELSDVEKKQAEERLNRLKTDIDNKRLAIKNLKMALERLDITDNIDVRIQQAELEYQLGREELNLLTLLEESRALQLCLDESNKNSSESHTLYSCVNGSDPVILLGIEIVYDPKSPKFGASQKDTMPGLWIDWALEETGMCKGDRLVEVNGKIVLTKSRDDLVRLLSAAPDPAQIVLLRKLTENGNKFISLGNTSKDVASLRSELEAVRERAEEAQKTKDNLISDNIRLTHRISYLEEQVSELLQTRNKSTDTDVRIVSKSPVISTVKTNQNVTNINITTQPTNLQNKELQVFQKGPQVTALVANLPGLETNKEVHTSLPIRSKSSMSNVSNTTISASELQQQSNENSHCHKSHRHNKSRSINKLEQSSDKITYRKHNHHHHHHHYNHEKDYSSETNSNVDISRYNKKNIENHRYSYGDRMNPDNSDNIMDQSFKKATKIVHELTKNREQNLYEKHRQKCITASEKYNGDILKHYNARKSASVLDFRSEIRIGVKQSDSKSVEELDTITTNNEPKVYKKIQDCRSVKSLDFDSDSTNLTNGYNHHHYNNNKHVDYTSEPDNNRKLAHYLSHHNDNIKPRPTPPKKPLRLSLHKTQSLQSVETSTSSTSSPNKNESRKRNYKGETSILSKIEQSNEIIHDGQANKWLNTKQIIENGENSSWC